MTVRELIREFPVLDEVSFIKDSRTIETIDCNAQGSWRAIRNHYDEQVLRVFAVGEDKIRIDSK